MVHNFDVWFVLRCAGRQRGESVEGTTVAKWEDPGVPVQRAVLVHNPGDDICCGVELTPAAGYPVDAPSVSSIGIPSHYV